MVRLEGSKVKKSITKNNKHYATGHNLEIWYRHIVKNLDLTKLLQCFYLHNKNTKMLDRQERGVPGDTGDPRKSQEERYT